MRALRFLLAAVAAGVVVASASAAAAGPRIVEAGGTAYPEQSYILTLPAARSLHRSQVHVTENGRRVSGLAIARQGTLRSRSAVVLVLDESLTMKGRPIAAAFAAARAFAAQANPDEAVAVVTFNGSVNVLHDFTTDAGSLDGALAGAPALAYGTKNYDALDKALGMLTSENVATRSIIILTDGQNVGSVAKPAVVLRALADAHVRVFSVGLDSPAFRAAPLEQMAARTGGSYVKASGPSALRPILVDLGRRLSSEYLVTYRSRANPGKKVEVAVSVKGITGVATSAYTTPALRLAPARPYQPSFVGRVIQSWVTMVLMALLFAIMLGFAVVHIARGRVEPLVERVGGFVAIHRSDRARVSEARQPVRRAPAFLSRVSVNRSDTGWYGRLARTLDIAGIELGPYQLVALTALASIFLAFVFIVLIGVMGILFGIATPFIVRGLLLGRVARKRRTFAEQLPDNLDVLASSLRAGHSLVSALSVVANDASEPSKSEFQRVIAEEQFGVQLEDAFQVAVDRMDNVDLDQVALVARLQREMGSNAAEVLDHVVDTVRSRMELRRLIQTLTAQGRLSRWILTLLPVGVAVALTLVAHSYMHPLLYRSLGRVLLAVAAVMVVVGWWIIGKIVDIELF